MELRDALGRRPVMPGQRAAIRSAMLQIEQLVSRGEDATAAIETLNETTDHSFGVDDFHYHCGAPDRKELVEWACAPPPVRLPDVTRDELVEIVRRILADPTDDWSIAAFDLNTVMPGASGLIFHPPSELKDATAEAIVDAVLAYRPIAL
ncbi:hypothetical protein [Actinoplanes regularis]|uniref:hypothetical protein n=1 Tax=Actinoplanes regularis TaxID=52697 RepID=UPI002552AB00|nr:hypothetical protein [Actinoplanes regularis]